MQFLSGFGIIIYLRLGKINNLMARCQFIISGSHSVGVVYTLFTVIDSLTMWQYFKND